MNPWTWTTRTASTKFYSKEGRLHSIFIYFPLCSFINLPFKTQITGRFPHGLKVRWMSFQSDSKAPKTSWQSSFGRNDRKRQKGAPRCQNLRAYIFWFWTMLKLVNKMLTCQREAIKSMSVVQPYSICHQDECRWTRRWTMDSCFMRCSHTLEDCRGTTDESTTKIRSLFFLTALPLTDI